MPSQISTTYTHTIGQVLWAASAGAQHYTVAAVTSEGVTVSCSTNDTNCAVVGMGCSQLYNVTVTAHNTACHSQSLEEVAIQTGKWTPPPLPCLSLIFPNPGSTCLCCHYVGPIWHLLSS